MSIAATIETLKRANETVKAAQHAIAKRGMFAMIEREHRYTSLLHGAYAGYVGFTPCIVASVDRAGIVKEVRLADGRTFKRHDWREVTVDSAGKVTDPAAVCEALREHAGGLAVEYHDKREAIRAIKTAAGL
jgi:hypothetical protein